MSIDDRGPWILNNAMTENRYFNHIFFFTNAVYCRGKYVLVYVNEQDIYRAKDRNIYPYDYLCTVDKNVWWTTWFKKEYFFFYFTKKKINKWKLH